MKKAMMLCGVMLAVIVACAPTPTATPVPPTATRAAIASPTAAAATKAATGADCAASNTLEQLGACITAKMPRKDTNGYVVPTKATQDAWKQVVAQMLAGKCDDIALPEPLKSAYTIGAFNGKENSSSYCVLMEILDSNNDGSVDRGWGTFIVNTKPSRELSIQAPHPLYDIGTESEAIAVFKGTNARSFMLAGSHRDANPQRTPCEASTGEGEADAAHNDTSLFFAATQTLADYYNANGKAWDELQFHGMGASTCPGVDAFISNGTSKPPKPGDKTLELRANIAQRNAQWVITVAGETPSCGETGGTNVEGRLLNNVSANQVCALSASDFSGRFIHIEQKTNLRAAIADWIAAINATWK